MAKLDLKTDFPTPGEDDWLALVEKGLRGAAFETLVHETEDGLARGPLMQADDLPPALAQLARIDAPLLEGRPWHISAPVRDPDLAHANRQLLDDLKGGASAVRIEAGSKLDSRSDLKRLLEGVFTDLVPISFAAGSDNAARYEMAASVKDLQTAHLSAGLDPIADEALIKAAVANCSESWRLMTLSPLATHEAGETDVMELAVLAAGLADALRRHGAETACRHLTVELAADRDAHLTIAKFRAARRLILRIAEAFDVDGSTIPVHAVTSLRMTQTEDAWTNLLRVMSAGSGAVMGGADFVTTRPFTDGLGKATAFAHRIARNMQLLMMEESHLGQVQDPTHGSYWHEAMTEKLAQAAWTKFQSIEAEGGIENYFSSKAYQSDLDAAITERSEQNAPILGVTLHPAKNVKAPEVRS